VLRASLLDFWKGTLEIASTATGLECAVPQSYPDGWQIVLKLDVVTPGVVRLSDGGKTLWQLAQHGQNLEAEIAAQRLREILSAFKVEREGWNLWRTVRWPIAGEEVHLFAEALVSVAHLSYLHDPIARAPSVARQTLEKVFRERRVEFRTNHRLEGRVEKRIEVDYFAAPKRPLAVQVLGRRGLVTGYMEQWGFRWRDLRDAHPSLLRVMLYDPAVQDVDATAAAIGQSVCEYFGPYHETDRLHEIVDRAEHA
jgi:hypothetical protein